MLPSMPVLFPRQSQSGDGCTLNLTPTIENFVEPVVTSTDTAVRASKKKKIGEEERLSDDDSHEADFVSAYYGKVRSKLGVEKWGEFNETLRRFTPGRDGPAALYQRLAAIVGDPELCEELLLFLNTSQAAAVGRLMDHLKMKAAYDFVLSLQSSLSRKPAKLRKVCRAVTSAGAGELCARVEPMLKACPRLLQHFRTLCPEYTPPESPHSSQYEEFPESSWSTDIGYQRLELETKTQACHTTTVPTITYGDGRVFIRQGRILRPATVTFPDRSPERHVTRLAPAPDPNFTQPVIEQAKNAKGKNRSVHCQNGASKSEKPIKKYSNCKKRKADGKNTEKKKEEGELNKKKEDTESTLKKEETESAAKKEEPESVVKKEETESAVKKEETEWTREEDKTILLVLKRGAESEQSLNEMKSLLPHRSAQELCQRLYHVMELLRQMTLGQLT